MQAERVMKGGRGVGRDRGMEEFGSGKAGRGLGKERWRDGERKGRGEIEVRERDRERCGEVEIGSDGERQDEREERRGGIQ